MQRQSHAVLLCNLSTLCMYNLTPRPQWEALRVAAYLYVSVPYFGLLAEKRNLIEKFKLTL